MKRLSAERIVIEPVFRPSRKFECGLPGWPDGWIAQRYQGAAVSSRKEMAAYFAYNSRFMHIPLNNIE